MGYRIAYENIGNKLDKKKRSWPSVIAVLCVGMLLTGAIAIKSVGLKWVQEVLIPGDPAVTAAALEGMVADLRQGRSLVDAVTAFCQEIINHGLSAE